MKLGIHYQLVPAWAKTIAIHWSYIVDPPGLVSPLNSRTSIIGRQYMPEGQEQEYINGGASGARAYFERWRPAFEEREYVWGWEGPNEPDTSTEDAVKLLVEFSIELGRVMREQLDRPYVALNVATGQPDFPRVPLLKPLLEEAEYWGLHEYSAPTMTNDVGYLCLRYRKTVEILRQEGLRRIPPLFITECGIDGGVIGQARKGWRDYTSEAGYWEQLRWYEGELQKDDYVVSAMIYTAGPQPDWARFDVRESLALHLDGLQDFEDALGREAQRHVIPQNPAATFYRVGRARGWEPISSEFDHNGYRAQVWYSPDEEMQHVLYARIGEWDVVRIVDRPN